MGFADHPGEEQFASTISLVALGAGAEVIEKHLTLGKVMEMEDFESALNPDEFQAFIAQLKTAEKALGNLNVEEDFEMSDAEQTYRKNVRRGNSLRNSTRRKAKCPKFNFKENVAIKVFIS